MSDTTRILRLITITVIAVLLLVVLARYWPETPPDEQHHTWTITIGQPVPIDENGNPLPPDPERTDPELIESSKRRIEATPVLIQWEGS